MISDFPIVYAQTKVNTASYTYAVGTIPAGSYTYFPSEEGVQTIEYRVKTYTVENKSGGDIDISLEFCNDLNYHGTDPAGYEWIKYYPRDQDYVTLSAGQSVTWSFRENLWYTRLKIENSSSTDAEVVLSRIFG